MDEVTSKIVSGWFRKKYIEIDQKIEPLPKVCKKGCDHCCHQSIEVLNWEEPLILDYIQNKLTKRQKDNIQKQLELWFDYFDLRMPKKKLLSIFDVYVDFNLQVAKDKIPCIFLEKHQCHIYDVRPISCRMHVTNDSAEFCKNDPLKEPMTEAMEIRKNVLREIIEKLPSSLILLNFSIAKLFGLAHRIRRVDENILEGI